ncbi:MULTISPECIES: DUF4386 domain-containing protein [unclassified Paraflavitalea]|uniref:DUF4386 domain-containing protein n=1 Tax=unclassified Paraflavitalea TaxID=2798305 RepID=UPI003D3458AA
MATEISNKKLARIAGLLYLGVVVTGIFTLMYVPFKLFNADNASLIFQNITSSQTLLRLGIVGGLLCYTFFLFLPLVLYKLLKTVNENYAKLMVLLAVLSVPVFFLNVQNLFSILSLIISGQSKLGLSKDQIQLAVMQHLDQYDNGLRIVHIFSGLWLFPFGYLVFKSGFLPKLLGVLLMLGCFGYLINFIGNTLIHDYSKTGISSYISLPASFGEIGTCLWLLVIGVKDKKQT